ncbi:MAG: hypothetical protein ACYSXF_04530 [Planctomycetota bacterium]|jgi:hypothetical protein
MTTTTRFARFAACAAGIMLFLLCGCAQYRSPGGPADFRAMGITEEFANEQTEPSIARRLDRKPLASFPAAVAVVRTQAPGYYSRTAQGYGRGRYSVVPIRDVETDEHFERISNLPMIRGIAPLNRIVLPEQFNSDLELRQGAANVQADMVLIYTLDTVFGVEQKIPPLGLLTLGLFPDDEARVTCTASGVLMDTRSGYVYGLVEATSRETQIANTWTSQAAVDQTRRRAETKAFDHLVGEFEAMWPDVIERYGPPVTPQAATGSPAFTWR